MPQTYTNLFDDIKLQLNRNDLDENIPSFIDLGERKVYRDLRCREMEILVSAATPDADSHLAVPADYLEANRFWIDSTGKKIEMVPMQRLRSITINNRGVPLGAAWGPLYVAREMSNFHFYPAVGTEVSYSYYGNPAPITVGNPTNVVIDVAYDALLFAAVAEGFDFIKEYQTSQHWLNKAIAVVNQLNTERKRQDKSGSTQVMGSPYAV